MHQHALCVQRVTQTRRIAIVAQKMSCSFVLGNRCTGVYRGGPKSNDPQHPAEHVYADVVQCIHKILRSELRAK